MPRHRVGAPLALIDILQLRHVSIWFEGSANRDRIGDGRLLVEPIDGRNRAGAGQVETSCPVTLGCRSRRLYCPRVRVECDIERRLPGQPAGCAHRTPVIPVCCASSLFA